MVWQTMATAKHTRYPALGEWEPTPGRHSWKVFSVWMHAAMLRLATAEPMRMVQTYSRYIATRLRRFDEAFSDTMHRTCAAYDVLWGGVSMVGWAWRQSGLGGQDFRRLGFVQEALDLCRLSVHWPVRKAVNDARLCKPPSLNAEDLPIKSWGRRYPSCQGSDRHTTVLGAWRSHRAPHRAPSYCATDVQPDVESLSANLPKAILRRGRTLRMQSLRRLIISTESRGRCQAGHEAHHSLSPGQVRTSFHPAASIYQGIESSKGTLEVASLFPKNGRLATDRTIPNKVRAHLLKLPIAGRCFSIQGSNEKAFSSFPSSQYQIVVDQTRPCPC